MLIVIWHSVLGGGLVWQKKEKTAKGEFCGKASMSAQMGDTIIYIWMLLGKDVMCMQKILLSLREMEKEIERDLLDGISNASGKTTLNQLFKMHMELKNDLRATTRENYNRMWHNTVEASAIGKKKISDIKQVHVKAFYADCVKAGLKRNTIKLIHNLIFSSFELAVDSDFIRKNPAKGAMENIKQDAGKRTILMTETVHRAFVELRKQNLILGRRSDAEVDGYGNFVFVSGNGQPFAINAVNSFLLNMEKAYNKAHPEETIPHLSAHILRHTGCTLLASAGMDIKALQNVMGHSDASITMNVYNHSSFERTEKEVQRIDSVINF